ncbi:NAD(P)H-binding protein [Tundrisphaera sp. TA3]|uniref:NAD(P)H-binding protein n=1 Tax=Tundrisphaera sp. TA3 TaxID=3435775 RepID=UPI003EC0DA26
MPDHPETILIAGGSGYVGSRLIPRLAGGSSQVRCLARNPAAMKSRPEGVEVVAGNVRDPGSLDRALSGVGTAYYLVHLMSDSKHFEEDDRRAARNFAEAARRAGVRRIVYMGGLGDDLDPRLSPHLRSRHEVGQILRESDAEVIEFRSSMIIGAGSLSYDMLKDLTERLPVMLCPRWLSTKTQPIAVEDVLGYLVAARDRPAGRSRVYEVGGPDVVTFMDLIREYARQKSLRRVLIPVPFLTPWYSGLWLALVTPSRFAVGRHLIEGLINPTIVRDTAALDDFPIRPKGVAESLELAIRGGDVRPS